ncbi:HEAT repeat domain-containing protein [Hyalangium versicolor]|uniref:HEAT repeat domain-containing protein n=1 Tax=Hyalangium versicolor TaxID=2861190 RepID=UPI001CCD6EC3|nr:HEAT repeat domain-containing protein [Hyalangium versicolor]
MSDERPDALLKSALEKIVYFEARADQLHHELEAARKDGERLKRELAETGQREIVLRRELAELEVRLNRSQAERDELARVNSALRGERTQLMGKLLDASRIRTADQVPEDDADNDLGIDLASFISQLRSEVLTRPEGASTPSMSVEAPVARSTPTPVAVKPLSERPPPPVPDEDEPLFHVGSPGFAMAMASAPKAASVTGASPVVQQAQRFFYEGRLGVSPQQLAELSGHVGPAGSADETLFGFSVRELSAADPAARIRAAERLKALAQPAAAPALATALHAETDPSVQVALIQAFAGLCREQGASVVSPLLASPVAEVRISALKALLSLAPDDAAPHLAQAMKDPDRAVRRRASLLALGLEGDAARRLGEEAIHDTDPEVRSLAALALGAASGEGARTLLLDALLDSEVRVRKSAAQSLSRILGHDVSAVVKMDEPQRRREVRRLATLPAQPVRASLAPPPPPRRAPVELAPAAPAAVRAPAQTVAAKTVAALQVPAAPVAPTASPAQPAPAPAVTLARSVPASAPERSGSARVALAAMGTRPASPPAPAPSTPAARPGPSPVEALCSSFMADIRAAIRGRSLGELTTALSAPVELAQEALTLLLARGAVIRRGHKYFAA